MTLNLLRIATRSSPLALWQAQYVADILRHAWPNLTIELVPMLTSGDRFLPTAKPQNGKGLFVKELEEALLHQHADIAVHSMKDVPARFPNGLGIAAIVKRDNPYDALVSTSYASIETLPLGATIGTSSLRRQSQLLALRPDLQINTVRGNIHTRLEKLQNTPFDAIILAASGLIRMNLQHHISQIIPEDLMLPACGQGALGIECRLADDNIRQLLSPIHDEPSALCVTTERQVNALLGGSCQVPVAVYCQLNTQTTMLLKAKVLSPDGKKIMLGQSAGPIETRSELAADCAEQLFIQGAKELLHSL